MMNHAEKRSEILALWENARPLTLETALSIAEKALLDHPKQRDEFRAWFKLCGEAAVSRVNNA